MDEIENGASQSGGISESLAASHAGLLTEAEHARLRQTKLLIAGCGVGSVVAVAAVRMGFQWFRVVDGDKVDARNLNRQAYSVADVGKLKAEALSAILMGINPSCKIEAVPSYLNVENVNALVSGVDLVIDAIDPTSALAIFALHRCARFSGKPIISPLDVGWGGALQVFLPDGPSLENIVGLSDGFDLGIADEGSLCQALLGSLIGQIPDYLQPAVESYLNGKLAHFPQPVSGAMIASSMVVVAAMRLVLGQPVRVGSAAAVFDPWLIHEVTGK